MFPPIETKTNCVVVAPPGSSDVWPGWGRTHVRAVCVTCVCNISHNSFHPQWELGQLVLYVSHSVTVLFTACHPVQPIRDERFENFQWDSVPVLPAPASWLSNITVRPCTVPAGTQGLDWLISLLSHRHTVTFTDTDNLTIKPRSLSRPSHGLLP